MNSYRHTHHIIVAALLAVGILMPTRPAHAQGVPVLLLLDANAVAAEQAPNLFSPEDVNASIAGVGVREPVRFFAQNADETVVLPGGLAGHEGWFAIGQPPSAWLSDPNAGDAAQNFLSAGPGLGSPDAEGNRTSLLASVAGVTPLTVTSLQALAGRDVCAIVFANELPWSPGGTSLDGPTSGVVAFSVLNALPASDGSVEVSIRILSVAKSCGGALSLVVTQ